MDESDAKPNHQQGSLWARYGWFSKPLALVIILILLIPSCLITAWSVIKIFEIAYYKQPVATTPIPALILVPTSMPHTIPVFAYPHRETEIRSDPAEGSQVIGTVKTTDRLSIVAKSSDGSWYKLLKRGWVAAAAVELPPSDLPVMAK